MLPGPTSCGLCSSTRTYERAGRRQFEIALTPLGPVQKIPDGDVNAKQAAQDMLARLNEAKEVLMDTEKRRIYDALGSNGLRQLTTTTHKANDLARLLEELRVQQELEHELAVARAYGLLGVRVDARDTYDYLVARNRRGRSLHAPEISALSAGTEFLHRFTPSTALLVHGHVSTAASEGAAIVRPDGLYTQRPPSSFVGLELRHEQRANHQTFAAGVTTDGSSLGTSAVVAMPLGSKYSRTSVEARVAHSTADGQVRPALTLKHVLVPGDKSVVAAATARYNDPAHVLELSVLAQNKGKVAVRASLNFGTAFFAASGASSLSDNLPELSFTWTRLGSARVSRWAQTIGARFVVFRLSHHHYSTLSAVNGLTVGYDVTRRLDKHTRLRFGSQVGLGSGLGWNVNYKRGNQEVQVPVHVCDDLPTLGWLAGLFLAPLLVDWITHHILLRPYYARQRAKRQREIMQALERARVEQRFMEREAVDRRNKERMTRGIIVLQARYGLRQGIESRAAPDSIAPPTWLAVHVAVQARVTNERDHTRLVLEGDLAQLPGFTDEHCGDEAPVLDLHYVYNGHYHHALIEEGDMCVLPSQEHRADMPARAVFDWPLHDATAEGAAGVGVD